MIAMEWNAVDEYSAYYIRQADIKTLISKKQMTNKL